LTAFDHATIPNKGHPLASKLPCRFLNLSAERIKIPSIAPEYLYGHRVSPFITQELPLVWSGFYAWPASVTVIHFEEQSETWAVPRALYVADTSAMRMAGLKPVPRGMGVMPFTQYL
jgi:hypothetical protein